MKPATVSRRPPEEQKVLVIEPRLGRIVSGRFSQLPTFLNSGDLLIVNDAATFPASIKGRTAKGESLELRLLPRAPDDPFWEGILFGSGDWRTRTEDRTLPPQLELGDDLILESGLKGKVCWISPKSFRWVRVAFNLSGAEVWQEIYRIGKPLQYSYLKDELNLWSVQNVYGSRPWASEMPSAGRPITGSILSELTQAGVQIAVLTHATGISSTGDRELDKMLPLPEFYEIPEATIEAIRSTRRLGGRIIAVGTSVVRALETNVEQNGGKLISGFGRTSLVLGPGFVPRVFDGILTGIHEVGETHFRLLEVFAQKTLLEKALKVAERDGYLNHEFGDSALILNEARRNEVV